MNITGPWDPMQTINTGRVMHSINFKSDTMYFQAL
jgi:hypothetical protein